MTPSILSSPADPRSHSLKTPEINSSNMTAHRSQSRHLDRGHCKHEPRQHIDFTSLPSKLVYSYIQLKHQPIPPHTPTDFSSNDVAHAGPQSLQCSKSFSLHHKPHHCCITMHTYWRFKALDIINPACIADFIQPNTNISLVAICSNQVSCASPPDSHS
jgi:hypothetical protein